MRPCLLLLRTGPVGTLEVYLAEMTAQQQARERLMLHMLYQLIHVVSSGAVWLGGIDLAATAG